MNSKFVKENDDEAKVEIRTDDQDDNELNNLVSTFWQHDDIQADIDEKKDDKTQENDDACFSADEIEELRDVFHTQTLTQRKKNELEDNNKADDDVDYTTTDVPDHCFFMPDMNRTLERIRCSSEEEDIRSQLEDGLLGESPNRIPKKSPIGKSPEMHSKEEKPPYISELIKSQSSGTVKSSLEVLISSSPKPELSVGSSVQHLNSYNSSIGSSAFADTLPIEESIYQENINSNDQTKSLSNKSLSAKSSSLSHGKESSSSNSHNDHQGEATPKTHRNKNSRRLSVITVPKTIPEIVDVDENSQEKAKCQQVTAVGTMYFSEDDFKSFARGYNTSDVANQVCQDPTTETAMHESVVMIDRDTVTTTTTGSEAEDRPDDEKLTPFRKSKAIETSVQSVDDAADKTSVCILPRHDVSTYFRYFDVTSYQHP